MTDRPILLAEDSAFDLDLMLAALRRIDLPNRIDIVRDGAEALAYLLEAARTVTCPAMALFDVKLPRVSGHEVLRLTRGHRQFCQMPIVMLSASPSSIDIGRSYAFGANAYLIKPLTFHALLDLMRSTMKFWIERNIPPPCAAPV